MSEKIYQIGVMVGNVNTQHPMELIRGICEAAKSENVNITFLVGAQGSAIEFWNFDENDLSSYNYQYNSLYDYSLIAGLDALIISYGTLCIYLDRDDRESFTSKFRSVPLVILEEYDEECNDSFIISDNYGSMYTIVDHLLSHHGYRKILYLSGPVNNTDSNERERAYRDAMKKYDLVVKDDMIEYGDYSSDVDHLVEALLDRYPDAEAIVAANDEMAVSIYNVCKKRGLVPGKDLAVTGYDDVEFAQRMDPPLTTANQDGLDMGYRALKCAVSLCKDPKPVKIKLPAQFLQRQSCGCKAAHSKNTYSLSEYLDKIKNSSDASTIEDAVSTAAAGSYLSIASEESKENGKEYFRSLIEKLTKMSENEDAYSDADLREEALTGIKDLCAKDSRAILNYSGFLRSYHQIIQVFMNKVSNKDILIKLSQMLETTDTYITSFVMRNDESRIMMLLDQSWTAPATIQYMIEKVDDENAFNRLAIENAVNQGAKSAYMFLMEEPLKCDREELFVCPNALELVAKYEDSTVTVYEKGKRPLVTKEDGFTSQYPDTAKHTYMAFMLFAKTYQYGILLCEIDSSSIGMMYSTALQISTAKAYMQISRLENETKQQLYRTLKELRDKNQVLSFVSSTDPLTGLLNRRGFMESAVTEVNTHTGSTAAIFFSDLDHLKQINDEFGHKDGDFALENSAKILKDTIFNYRKDGVVCGRIGGDEFVSFMICDDKSDTEKVLQLLKENCAKFNDDCDKPYYVEFSTGCICFECSDDCSLAELTSQADACLYEAKKNRRTNIRKEL